MISFKEHARRSEPGPRILKESLENPIDTIRKLLALAARPGTKEEGECARQQAERIAEKYGIDINTVSPEPPKPAPPPRKPINPFCLILLSFGWRAEYNPFHKAYAFTHNNFDLRGHSIELGVNGWTHTIDGRSVFGGRTPEELYSHLRSNVH